MALTRLRMDELVNAWVADRSTPFQIALLGVFDAAPFLRPDGTLDVPRIRRELVARARRVEALRRRVVWTRFGEGMPVWAPDPSFDPDRHVEGATLPAGADLATWAADRILRPPPAGPAAVAGGGRGRPAGGAVRADRRRPPRRRRRARRRGPGRVAPRRTADFGPPGHAVPAAPPLPSHADADRRPPARAGRGPAAAPGRSPGTGSAVSGPGAAVPRRSRPTCARARRRRRCRGRSGRRAG